MTQNWAKIENEYTNASLLMGNGFSINISDRFSYDNLKEKTSFGVVIERLFNLRGTETTNFEEVLFNLAIALEAVGTLKGSPHSIRSLKRAYEIIRRSLYNTLIEIHPSKRDFLDTATDVSIIRNYLRSCSQIYTTNYDLFLPWIILSQPQGRGFTDFFFGGPFDSEDTEIRGDKKPVFYLHGAIFLESGPSKAVSKLNNVAGIDNNIQAIRDDTLSRNRYPLIVTEGHWIEKQASINSHAYLNYCLSQLKQTTGNLVVFGHSLSKRSDAHIVSTINKPTNNLAIGIYVGNRPADAIEAEKIEFRRTLNNVNNISFFNSSTHPLANLDGINA